MALDTNLVSIWKLDGNSNDSVGSNNGTDTGISYNASYGKISQGALFNATSDKILIANESQFDFERTQAFSVSVWLKLATLNSTKFFVTKQQASGNYTGWSLWYTYSAGVGNLDFSLVGTPANMIEVLYPTLPDNNYHLVTATYSGNSLASGVELYVDAVKQTKGTTIDTLGTTTILNNIQLELGNRNGAFNMDGNMDEVGIWSRALSASEVTELYNGGAGLTYPFASANQANFLAFF